MFIVVPKSNTYKYSPIIIAVIKNSPIIFFFGDNPSGSFNTSFLKSSKKPIIPNPTNDIIGKISIGLFFTKKASIAVTTKIITIPPIIGVPLF